MKFRSQDWIVLFSSTLLFGIWAATVQAAAPRVPKEVYDVCKSVVDNIGLGQQTLLLCGAAPTPPKKRLPAVKDAVPPSVPPRKTFVYELDQQSPLRTAIGGAGVLELRFKDGDVMKCPAAAIAETKLVTTATCGDKLWSEGGDQAPDTAIVHLGADGSDAGGSRYHSDSSIRAQAPILRIGAVNLAIFEFNQGGNPGAASVPMPRHAPSEGDALIAYDPNTARYLTHCSVQAAASEDLSRFGYGCTHGNTSRANWSMEGGVLLLDAKDRSLVGFAMAPSPDGEPRFASVRALLTTSDAGRMMVGDATRVLGCFNSGGGHRTIQEMFDCSGVWVTPTALLRCSMGTQCPVYSDDVVGRAGLDAALASENMKVGDVLILKAKDLPPQPSRAAIDSCNASEEDAPNFTKCVIGKTTSADFGAFMDCVRTSEGSKRAGCITSKTNDALLVKVVACLDGAQPSPASILRCSHDDAANAALKSISQCASGATDRSGVAGCLFASAPPAQRRIAECVASGSGANRIDCLRLVSPDIAKAGKVVDCLHGIDGDELAEAADCVGTQLPGDAGKIAGCLGNPDRETAARCLLGDKPEVKAAEQIYQCASTGRDVASVMANCTQGLGLDPKTQQALSCTAKAGSDRAQLLACASQLALPPEAARLVSCAASSGGPAGFAICASGPIMNEEWRIAAECAVESGGQPYATAACAATRLTIRELTACFRGQVGKDCFGPNNTIVKTVTNAFNDVVHGPGKNNEVVKAIASINEGIERLSPEAAKFVERPLGSDQAVIPKARDDLLNGLHVGGSARKVIDNPLNPLKWL